MGDYDDEQCLKMAALSRRIKIGDTYDFVNDIVTRGARNVVKPSDCQQDDEAFEASAASFETKWDHLDPHLQASLLCGLIDKPSGANSYVTEPTEPSRVTWYVNCRVVSRKETITSLEDIVPALQGAMNEMKTRKPPTHIVKSVVYGAEIHCELSQTVSKRRKRESKGKGKGKGTKDKSKANKANKKKGKGKRRIDDDDDDSESSEEDEDSSSDSGDEDDDSGGSEDDDDDVSKEERNAIERELSKIARKMQEAFEDNLSLDDFERLFNRNERRALAVVKCSLHFDVPKRTYDECCGVLDAYSHFLGLKEDYETAQLKGSKDVAIEYELYPLGALLELPGRATYGPEGEVDRRLLDRYAAAINNFELAIQVAEELKDPSRKERGLSQFITLVNKYKELVCSSLRDAVLKKRQDHAKKKDDDDEQSNSGSDDKRWSSGRSKSKGGKQSPGRRGRGRRTSENSDDTEEDDDDEEDSKGSSEESSDDGRKKRKGKGSTSKAKSSKSGSKASADRKRGKGDKESNKKGQSVSKSTTKKRGSKRRDDSDDDSDEQHSDGELSKQIAIVEKHKLFQLSALKRWLRFKELECKMYDEITSVVKRRSFVTKRSKLQDKLASGEGPALVLVIPPLDDVTADVLKKMKEFANHDKLVSRIDKRKSDKNDGGFSGGGEDKVPWCTNQHHRKTVLDKVQQLADFQKKNKATHSHVLYLVAVGELSEKFECTYSVFEAEDQLVASGMTQLPRSPKDVQVNPVVGQQCSSPPARDEMWFHVSWIHDDSVQYPVKYLIEYKKRDVEGDCWASPKRTDPNPVQDVAEATVLVRVAQKTSAALEFRVAVDTCFGRSDYSDGVDASDSAGTRRQSKSPSDSSVGKDESQDDSDGTSDRSTDDVTNDFAKRLSIARKKEEEKISTDAAGVHRSESTHASKSKVQIQRSASQMVGGQSRRGGRDEMEYDAHEPNKEHQASGKSIGRSASVMSNFPIAQPRSKLSHIERAQPELKAERAAQQEEKLPKQNQRFCQSIVERCEHFEMRNGLAVISVPLTKITTSVGNTSLERYSFGANDESYNVDRKERKTILVMGATGAGKTTLINSMINYIFDVEWDDPFRFQLIQETTSGQQDESQTNRITAYDIYHCDGFRIPYSLTIVDTPGYGDTRGIERDEQITDQVRMFFKDRNGIQDVNVVGFVAGAASPRLTPTQVYIFNSVLSIFGKDIEDNIRFLLTFADSQLPPVLGAINEAKLPCPKEGKSNNPLHYKFNSSGYFCSNRPTGPSIGIASNAFGNFNKFFWDMGMKNFEQFFSDLPMIEPRSLSLTGKVLEHRKQLEATIKGLQPLVKSGLVKMEEMRRLEQEVSRAAAKIKAKENIKFDVDITEARKEKLTNGDEAATNCPVCEVTCHRYCSKKHNHENFKCSVMDHAMPELKRTCTVCPKQCKWDVHINEKFEWISITRKRLATADEVKKLLEEDTKKKVSDDEMLSTLQHQCENTKRQVMERVETVAECIRKLDEIALRPNPYSTLEYIDFMLNKEEEERKPGYLERISSLNELRGMASLANRIKRKEDVLRPEEKF